MKMSFDVPFTCPENIEPYLQKVFDGEYDIPMFMTHPKVIDLGANCGAFSVWACHRWPGAEVLAYEPHPETYKILEENTKLYKQIRTFNYGVGLPGLRLLLNGKNNCGEASFNHPMDNPSDQGQHLEVRSPLELPDCDILKMDIEGCEVEVMEPLIKAGRRPPIILFEYHNQYLRRQMDDLLADYFLIGAAVYNPIGLGVMKYIRADLLKLPEVMK